MKISVITGSRSEFDLLKNLIIEIKKEKFFKLNLIVTGSHVSKVFGSTIDYIKKNGLKVNKIVDLSISGDTSSHISKSFAIGVKKFTCIFKRWFVRIF